MGLSRMPMARSRRVTCETARDLTPNRLPTVTLVGLTISRLIQCVTARGMGSNFDADRTSDPTPNNMHKLHEPRARYVPRGRAFLRNWGEVHRRR
jgi:hypothetical protein